MKVLAIPGSNRQKSHNKSLIRAFQEVAPKKLLVEVFEIDNIPMFNQDLETDLPEEVKSYIQKVREADAVVISTPEYNNMIPGILKNAIEWLTRGYSNDAIKNKPLGIMGATEGGFGTVRAQNMLLELATIVKFRTHSSLRLPISHADKIFNEKGELDDEETKVKLVKFAEDLYNFTKKKEL